MRESQKNICFLEAKAFDCVDHNKLWEILKEMGVSDHITYLLRNLCGVKKKQNRMWNNQLFQNCERSTRLYIVTLFI